MGIDQVAAGFCGIFVNDDLVVGGGPWCLSGTKGDSNTKFEMDWLNAGTCYTVIHHCCSSLFKKKRKHRFGVHPTNSDCLSQGRHYTINCFLRSDESKFLATSE